MDLPTEIARVAHSGGRPCRPCRRCHSKKKAEAHGHRFFVLTTCQLLTKQRFNVQTLRLQDFTQTTQAFNLNLAYALAGQTDFAAHIFKRCRFIA